MGPVLRHVDETCHIYVFDVTIGPRAECGRTIRDHRRRRMNEACWTGDERDYTVVVVDIAGVTVVALVHATRALLTRVSSESVS